MDEISEKIQKQLFEVQDLKNKAFVCKLIPTVDPDTVIGVRTPDMRKIAKEFVKTPDAMEYLKILPHRYYEENNIHGSIIMAMKDYDAVINETERFLPYIDNWATCDSLSPKIFKKHTEELYEKIKIWIKSDKTYTIRFAIGMLMGFYLDEYFTTDSAELVAQVRSEEYYVNMMTAWYFATALAKQYDATIGFITGKSLDKWTHNKAIQKAVESRRITDEQKVYLRTLKIK
ncbi:MAG: DNA alkylation repair protein [Oscillospiraceae bacterium]|nr:DNA alkylation repair protein [Oscillospiraceae bacterium]